jgi:hypothetical protein
MGSLYIEDDERGVYNPYLRDFMQYCIVWPDELTPNVE